MKKTDRAIVIISILLFLIAFTFLINDAYLSPIQDSKNSIGEITASNNDVRFFKRSNLLWSKTNKGKLISNGDGLFTGKKSTATIRLNDDQEIKVSPNSMIFVKINKKNIDLNVEFGRFKLGVPKGKVVKFRSKNKTYTVEGNQSQLDFEVNEKGETEVSVLSGEVTLRAEDGTQIDLKKGERLIEEDDFFEVVENPLNSERVEEVALESENEMDEPQEPIEEREIASTSSSELLPPESLIKERYVTQKDLYKYPVNIRWTEVQGAKKYEIIFMRSDRPENYNSFIVRNKNFHTMIFRNKDYQWKVRALDEKGQAITAYSTEYDLKYIVPENDLERSISAISDADNEIIDDAKIYEKEFLEKNNTNTAKVPELIRKGNYRKPWYKYWGVAGLGGSQTTYDQKNSLADIDFETVQPASLYLEGGTFYKEKHGAKLSYRLTPDEIAEVASGSSRDYQWSELSLEGVYLFGHGVGGYQGTGSLSVSYGVQMSEVPYLQFDTSTFAQGWQLIENKFITASLGLSYNKVFMKKLRANLGFRYLHILSSDVSSSVNHELDTGTIVDGTIGLSYQMYDKYTLGFSWYAKQLELEHSYTEDGVNSIIDKRSVLFQSLDFRLGIEY